MAFGSSDGFASLSVGTIRSGKTYSCVLSFGLYTQRLAKSYNHLICGRKLRVMEQELLPIMYDVAKLLKLKCHYAKMGGKLTMGNQTYILAAGNDDRSPALVMGLTAHSGLIDEATEVPEPFFNAVISRFTFSDSKVWITCNPSYPLHFLKKKWVDENKIDLLQSFTFNDNPVLNEATKERYRSMFTGIFARRMVDGLWSVGDGLIYPDILVEDTAESVLRHDLAIDYGTASTTAILVIATRKNNTYSIIDEMQILGGSDVENKTDSEICAMMQELVSKYNIQSVTLDPSAASFRAALFQVKGRRFNIRKANNDVLPGIRFTMNALANRKLTVSGRCVHLLDELKSYSWDDKKEDRPVKANDHFCDAMRYGVMAYVLKEYVENIKLPEGM